MLNEQNYIDVINGYSLRQWQPVLDLIPKIDEIKSLGEANRGSASTESFPDYSSIESLFHHLVYSIPLMIVFDWPHWEEGEIILSNPNFDYNTIDIPTKCKILSAIVRNDRFSENLLYVSIEDGHISKILKSIAHQLSVKCNNTSD